MQRINRIMNDPIENLVLNTKSYGDIRPLKKIKNRNVTTAPIKRQQGQDAYGLRMRVTQRAQVETVF